MRSLVIALLVANGAIANGQILLLGPERARDDARCRDEARGRPRAEPVRTLEQPSWVAVKLVQDICRAIRRWNVAESLQFGQRHPNRPKE